MLKVKQGFQAEGYILRLRELMRRNNLTYEAVANKIGKRRETIVNYLNNKTKLSFEDFLAILQALDISPCYFFDCGNDVNMQQIKNSGVVAGEEIDVRQVVGSNASLEKELVLLKTELEGYKKLIEEKDERIKELKQMVDLLKKMN